jgi:hypothetical protein
MPKKKAPRPLGIVPRTLLRGAIAGAIPACALTGCTSQTMSIDASPDATRDTNSFGVAQDAFSQPGAPDFAPAVDAAAFSVADTSFTNEPPDAGALQDGVADIGFRPDAGADGHDAAPDFFAVDAAAFKG